MASKPDDKLQQLVSRLQYACGDALAGVVLYGSAARDEHRPARDAQSA